MAKIAFRASLVGGALLLLGVGSCGPQIPETVTADGVSMEEAMNGAGNEEAVPGRLQDCSPGTADCDRDPKNGCEAVLAADLDNCGVCGVICSSANAEAGCLGGTCRVISCKVGFCDRDGDPDNGCETEAKVCHP